MTAIAHPVAAPAGGSVQAVVFALASETFALPVATVREILEYRPASRVPEGPDWLLGLLDVRGVAVAADRPACPAGLRGRPRRACRAASW